MATLYVIEDDWSFGPPVIADDINKGKMKILESYTQHGLPEIKHDIINYMETHSIGDHPDILEEVIDMIDGIQEDLISLIESGKIDDFGYLIEAELI